MNAVAIKKGQSGSPEKPWDPAQPSPYLRELLILAGNGLGGALYRALPHPSKANS
jgi:hypothetical protein